MEPDDTHFRDTVDSLASQPETLDRDFWREYLYWSWRCLAFVLFVGFLVQFDLEKGLVGSFSHISTLTWVALILVPLLFGPLVVVVWAKIWSWLQDRFL